MVYTGDGYLHYCQRSFSEIASSLCDKSHR
jgi:hypothetical protein